MTYWQICSPLILMGVGLPFFFVPVTIVQTAWEDQTSSMHAELAGLVDRSGETARALASSGMSADAVRASLDNLLQGQSVMLATNQIMGIVAAVCCAAAFLIWLAPKPARAVDMTQAGH